jgi:hypothetical protein
MGHVIARSQNYFGAQFGLASGLKVSVCVSSTLDSDFTWTATDSEVPAAQAARTVLVWPLVYLSNSSPTAARKRHCIVLEHHVLSAFGPPTRSKHT